jgi:hypothetical protein
VLLMAEAIVLLTLLGRRLVVAVLVVERPL